MTARYFNKSNGTLPTNGTTVGDMIVAVKAALITGYNGNPSAGWELVYEPSSTATDIGKRIAVRSKSVNSEQRIFEITDISATEGKIQCFTGWSGTSGTGLLASAKINKNNWGSDTAIVADEKFVHLFTRNVYHAFGDMDVFDTSKPKTVIYNMQNTTNDAPSHSIASTNQQSSNYFIDVNNKQRLHLRSFCNEYISFGAKTQAGSGSPYYDFYNGGDTNAQATGVLTSVRKAEILKYVSSTNFVEYGFLPMMCYTDNPVTMANKNIVMEGVNKKLIGYTVDGAAMLTFAVDV